MARVFLSPGKKNVELFLKKWFFKIEKKQYWERMYVLKKLKRVLHARLMGVVIFGVKKKIDPLPLRNLGRKNSTKNRKIKYKKINLKNKVERWQSPVVGWVLYWRRAFWG